MRDDHSMITAEAASRAARLAAFRAEFPATGGSVYANVASRSIISRATRRAIDVIVDSTLDGSGSKEAWQPLLGRARAGFAGLIGAGAHEVALTKNVSEGINIVAAALDWRAGDNVVLSGELEHPNNTYAWLNLERRGVELRLVPPRGIEIDAERMAAAIDGRTRVAAVSSVTFTPGFRTALEPLGRACRARDVLFLVDAVQSAGVLQIDVEALAIDALATSSSKGLLGLVGLGFLYCRDAWTRRLEPAYAARFSIDGGEHKSEMGALELRWHPNARRFEIGNYNWAAISGIVASLDQLRALGASAIEAQAVGVAARLADGLERLGLPVCRPADPRLASHIVTVGQLGAGGAYSSADPRLNQVAAALEQDGVRFSIRRGQLRFGFHAYNDQGDVERILDTGRRALAGGR